MAKIERKLSFIPIVKVHPSKIITYNEVHWSPYPPPRTNLNNVRSHLVQVEKNGKIELKRISTAFLNSSRQGNGYLSAQAKKRLKLAIEYFLLLNKPINGKSGNSGQHYNKRITFITLTLPSKQVHTDNEIKSQCLNQFLIEISRYHKVNQYVWRAEYQKNGNIHFHILANNYIIWKDVRNRWNRIINKLNYVDEYRKEQENYHEKGFKVRTELLKTWPAEQQKKAYERGKRLDWRDPNSTDIHSIYGITNIKAYLTKYLTKEEKTLEEHSNSQIEEQKKIGRSWAASSVLANIKGASTIIDSEIEEHLKNIEEHFPNQVYKDKYFTVIDITLEMLHTLKCNSLEELFQSYLLKEFGYCTQLIL
jgi:hypothetical protein